MARTILVPLDGSALAAGVLERAAPLWKDPAIELELLGVVPAGGAAAEVEDSADRLQAALEKSAAGLGRPARVNVIRGDAAEGILRRMGELNPELVVLGTHGRSGVERWVRGSVAERVLRHATAPLLLCNPRALAGGALGPKRILVPLDGSPLADEILPLVTSIARTFGAEVVLLRVEPLTMGELETAVPVLRWDPALVLGSLLPQEERLRAAGLTVHRRASYGIEAAEILRAAEDADLVAMSTHGRAGASRWLLGSVAEQVLRHCSRPLLVRRAVRPR